MWNGAVEHGGIAPDVTRCKVGGEIHTEAEPQQSRRAQQASQHVHGMEDFVDGHLKEVQVARTTV